MCRIRGVCSCSVLLPLLAAGLACSGREAPPPAAASRGGGAGYAIDLRRLPGTRFNVTYTERTVQVEPEVFRKALKSASRNRRVFVFEKSAEPFAHLAPGSILFIKHLAIRKVVAVATEGDYLYVGTDRASIPDVIRNGDMHWSAPIKFGEAHRARRNAAMPTRAPAFRPAGRPAEWRERLTGTVWAYSDGAQGEEGDRKEEKENEEGWEIEGVLSGWNYTMHSVPAPDRLNLDVQLDRKKGMNVVNVGATGYIQNFETNTTVLVQDSVMKYFDYSNKDLNGDMKLSWSAVKAEEGKEDPQESEARLKLPTSFSVQLLLGELPFTLEVSEAVIVAPVFSQKGDAARGSFHVSYTGTQGFALKGGQVSFEGKTDGDAGIQQYGAVSRTIPGTCLVAIAFPKIELKPGFEHGLEEIEDAVPSSLADKALAYLKANAKEDLSEAFKTGAAAFFSVGISTSALSSGIASPVPCQGSHLTVSAKVGAEANVLGVTLLALEKEVFSRKVSAAVPPIKGCLGQ